MNAVLNIRVGGPDDAIPCAGILNNWIDQTAWMPRVHSVANVVRHYQEFVFKKRRVFVAGDPVAGYICLDDNDWVTSLYTATPGQGVGKALLDHVKRLANSLRLWTFVANTDARRFYQREGFVEIDRSEGDNEENLPDVCYRWESAQ